MKTGIITIFIALLCATISAFIMHELDKNNSFNSCPKVQLKDDFDSVEFNNQSIAYVKELCQYIANNGHPELTPNEYNGVDPYELEDACDSLFGDKFWRWRRYESKQAWDYDVLIARWCY